MAYLTRITLINITCSTIFLAFLASYLRDQVSVYTKSPLTYPEIPGAKMGEGADGYRAVAYFVNVSAHSEDLHLLSNIVRSGKSV